MMNYLNKLTSLIKSSLYDVEGKTSHSKLSSYFILGSILLANLAFIAIDVMNGIVKWKTGAMYEIPLDHIVIYSLTLTHHLVLLGLKKGSEVNYMNAKLEMSKANLGIISKEEKAVEEPKAVTPTVAATPVVNTPVVTEPEPPVPDTPPYEVKKEE